MDNNRKTLNSLKNIDDTYRYDDIYNGRITVFKVINKEVNNLETL